jgi:putative two-component system response regulator
MNFATFPEPDRIGPAANADLTFYRMMVVDDEAAIRSVVVQAVGRKGYECLQAKDGLEALEIMARTRVDLVITDINMPGMDGLELTRNIRKQYDTDVVIMTGFTNTFNYEGVMPRGASDFLEKPVSPKELYLRVHRVLRERKNLEERNRAERENKKALERLKKAIGDIIFAMSRTMELRDPYTAQHQRRAAALAEAIGKQIGLDPIRLEGLSMGGFIHDLGKISIPSEILSKPAALTKIEYAIMKTHPQTGYDILKNIDFPWPLAEIALQHHERLDGSGYPSGLKGEQIIFEARIMAVADVVEAMTSHRPYRSALGVDQTLDYVAQGSGTVFDSVAVKACLNVFEDENFTF